MEQSVKTHTEFEQKIPLNYQERAHRLQQHGAEVGKKGLFRNRNPASWKKQHH